MILRLLAVAGVALAAGLSPGLARAGDPAELADVIVDDVIVEEITGAVFAEVDAGRAPSAPVDVGATIARIRADVSTELRRDEARAPIGAARLDGAGSAEPARTVEGAAEVAAALVVEVDRIASPEAALTPAEVAGAGAAPSRQRPAPSGRTRVAAFVAESDGATAGGRAATAPIAGSRERPTRLPRSRGPASPRRFPQGPSLPESGAAAGGAPGFGLLLPSFAAALAAFATVFALQLLTRRVRFPRSPRPRHVALPPWRPG